MNTEDQLKRLKDTGRNDPCPCGSGKKYKKCHLFDDEAAQHEVMKKAAEEREAALAAESETDEESTEKKSGSTKNPTATDSGYQQKGGKPKNSPNRPGNIPRRGAV